MAHLEQFEQADTGLLVRAPAKINLSLLITGKRPDGYHGIETLMAKINWYDELLFEPSNTHDIELICTGPQWAPPGEENLILHACEKLMEKCGRKIPVRVTLTKNIPAGTGLGSASSDAAAALMGLNRFADFHLPDTVLHEIAASLGSDINFFLGGPLAYCTGRGEKIHKIDTHFDFGALLLIPNISISTKRVYENYTHSPEVYQQLSEKINPLLAKKNVDSVAEICANMLESSCFQLENRMAAIKQTCERLCDSKVSLSGSGSAMYILVPALDESLLQLQETLKTEFGCESRFVNNNRW
jgi:4-diphosphocytidyl-2-C-methyl-D-erythritol kinase